MIRVNCHILTFFSGAASWLFKVAWNGQDSVNDEINTTGNVRTLCLITVHNFLKLY